MIGKLIHFLIGSGHTLLLIDLTIQDAHRYIAYLQGPVN